MVLLNTVRKGSALNTWVGARSFHLTIVDMASETPGSLLTLSSHHFQHEGWKSSGRHFEAQLMNRAEGFDSFCLALSSSLESRNLNSHAEFDS